MRLIVPIVVLIAVALTPYALYVVAISRGISLGSVRIEKYPEAFYRLGRMNLKSFDILGSSLERWRLVHFHNFKLPLPMRHPSYLFIPEALFRLGDIPSLGARFSDGKDNLLFAFQPGDSVVLIDLYRSNPLFSVRLFKDWIESMSEEAVWHDVFSKQIGVDISPFSYRKLVYNLFILGLRAEIFPRDIEGITHIFGRQFGLVRLRSSNGKLWERVFFFRQGRIHSIGIETNGARDAGSDYRDIFLRTVDFRKSNADAAVAPYAKFKALSFDRKVSQEGVAYLYASLSHDPDNEGFIREILLLLDKRRGETGAYLEFFRDYAFNRHGGGFLEGLEGGIGKTVGDRVESEADGKRKPAGATRRERVHSLLKSRREKRRSGVLSVE